MVDRRGKVDRDRREGLQVGTCAWRRRRVNVDVWKINDSELAEGKRVLRVGYCGN